MNIRRSNRFHAAETMSQAEVNNILEEEEEEIEKMEKNIIYDHFQEDPKQFYNFCGFNADEFTQLYSMVEEVLAKPTRGRRNKFTIIDQFLLFLHYLRSYPRIEYMKTVLDIEPSTFQNIFDKILEEVSPLLIDELITKSSQEINIVSDDRLPDSVYVVDATVQQINQPSLDFKVAALYY